MTYKELTEKMSKENLSQMEGSDEMLRSAEGADMELSIDDLGLIAGGVGNEGLHCKMCGDPVTMINTGAGHFGPKLKHYKCPKCGIVTEFQVG